MNFFEPGKSLMLILSIFLSGMLPAENEILKTNQADPPGILIVGGGTHHDFDRWFNPSTQN